MLSLSKVLSDSLIKWHLTFSKFNVPARTAGRYLCLGVGEGENGS